MTSSFTCVTQIAAPPARVCALSLDVDVHQTSMAESGETIVDGVRSGKMTLGDTVTWRARHFGIWFRMTSIISELDAPHGFVDEQVRGPFAAFHHVHTFDDDGVGGTVMTDTITLRAPLGPIGMLVERAGLVAYMKKLIAQRNDTLAELATAPIEDAS